MLCLCFVFGLALPASATTLDPFARYTFETDLRTDDSGNGNIAQPRFGVSLAVGEGRLGGNAMRVQPSGGTSGLHTGIDINIATMPNMSMGAWVNANGYGTANGGKILSDDNAAFGRTLGFDNRGNDAGIDFAAFAGTGVVDADETGNLLNLWVHVAVVYNGGASGLFVNGTLREVFTDNTFTLPSLTSGLVIGANDHFNEEFDGLIDDVFVFDRALTSEEIRSIYTFNFEPKPTPAPATVPLPAAFSVLLGALISLVGLRRRWAA